MLSHYSNKIRRVLIAVMVMNITIVLIEIIAGIFSNSLALIGDGVNTSTDVLGNLVGLIIVRYSAKEPDEDHPYGHRKIETLAAFSIAALLAISFFEILIAAIGRLSGSTPPHIIVTPVIIVSVAVTVVLNLGIMIYESYQGNKQGSHFLKADAKHTRSDIIVSLAVLADVLLVRFYGYPELDAMFGIVVAILIAYTGYTIVKETVPILVDASALPQREVFELVKSVGGVVDVFNIRTRGWEGNYFIELTITSNIPDAREAHEITEIVESALREHYGPSTITIHLEPTTKHS